jgi:hypothetical protein
MKDLNVGDAVCYVYNGREYAGRIISDPSIGEGVAVRNDDGLTETIHRAKLLRPKGPFFEVRGLVQTTSASHPGEVGEIIATGKNDTGKRFFHVQFKTDPTREWISEDHLFIADISV